MTQWTFEPILGSYLVVSLLTLGMVALLAVRPTFRRLQVRQRWTLLAVRALVILFVLTAMLRPTRISTTSKPQTAELLLLFDQSRSMQLPHAAGNQTRWQAQQEALRRIESILLEWSEQMEVAVFAYDRQLHPIAFEQGHIQFPAEPTGPQTDIGTALDEAVRRELGKKLAAVILCGDGAQTAFTPRVEVQEAGRTLARLEYPLFTVAFGPAGDAAQSRDVAVENLPEQYTVFVKNELPVKGVLRVRGYVNQPIPVELLVEDSTGRSSLAGTVQVQAREDGGQIPVEIPFTPLQPGQYKLTLRATEQAGELVTRNNQLSAFVTVLEGGLRVLYLYGDLMGEQRLLRRSLSASPDIQLEEAFVDPRNRDRWPVDLGGFLTQKPFDVLLLESVDAGALGDANLQAMALAVEQGRGLLMIGGFNSFGPGGYASSPLADVLPVEMGRLERQGTDPTKPISRDLHLWGELGMRPVRSHPIVRLGSEEENPQIWSSLPALQGANRFAGVKPRAQLLAETPAGEPLLVAGEYGRGRVLAFAGNSTYRWWQYGRPTEHRRFWRQTILWLAQRDDTAQNDVWVKLPQRRFDPGAPISFTAGARSATGDVIRDASFTARLLPAGGQPQTIRLTTDQDQVSGALERIEQPGDYLIEIEALQSGRKLGTARAHFQVLDRDAELGNPAANYDLLARLANLTKDAGGRPVAPEQLPSLLREITERQPEVRVEIESRWQLGDTTADAWLFLLALVGLLTTEWILRKRWGLV